MRSQLDSGTECCWPLQMKSAVFFFLPYLPPTTWPRVGLLMKRLGKNFVHAFPTLLMVAHGEVANRRIPCPTVLLSLVTIIVFQCCFLSLSWQDSEALSTNFVAVQLSPIGAVKGERGLSGYNFKELIFSCRQRGGHSLEDPVLQWEPGFEKFWQPAW